MNESCHLSISPDMQQIPKEKYDKGASDMARGKRRGAPEPPRATGVGPEFPLAFLRFPGFF
jgi:hypothetical protein